MMRVGQVDLVWAMAELHQVEIWYLYFITGGFELLHKETYRVGSCSQEFHLQKSNFSDTLALMWTQLKWKESFFG